MKRVYDRTTKPIQIDPYSYRANFVQPSYTTRDRLWWGGAILVSIAGWGWLFYELLGR